MNVGSVLPRSFFRTSFAVLASATLISAPAVSAASSARDANYDTIVRGGTIIDGSGLAPYVGDVAISGGHIAAVGDLGRARATANVDAKGMIVAPGFINIHSHARPDAVATAFNMLTQGVTTEITNADGHGTTDIAKQLTGFTTGGLAENLGLYIGFNAVWSETVGPDDRRATPAEIARMRGLIDGNLAQGAWGVAAALDYKPGYYAEADEVVKVISAARKWRTNFPNHDRIRPEDDYSSYKAIAETLTIAEQAGLVPVVTHMKIYGVEQGTAPKVIAMMDATIARGTYVAADVYPYTAGLSGLSLNVPGWAIAGGREAMLKRFADPATRARIVPEIERSLTYRWKGAEGVYLFNIDRELADIVREMGVRPGEAVVRLLEQQEHSAILRYGKESDVVDFLKWRNSAMACDCGASVGARGHPRTWGSFPRTLGRYVRDQNHMSWAEVIRKSTALPATIIGMNDRGYLAPGMAADVAVFDPKTVIDHSTYKEPTKPSVGFRHVFVNGRHALRDGVATGQQGGAVMLRTPHMPSRPMTAADRRRSASGAGAVGNGASRFDLSFKVAQRPGRRYATGRVRLVDRTSGAVWTADRLGVIQTGTGWASVTAVLRDGTGKLRPAVITVDSAGPTATPAKPTLVLRLDGGAELTGPPRGRVRIAAR